MSEDNQQKNSTSINAFNEYNMRLARLSKLREKGYDPYPAKSDRTHTINELENDFEKFDQNNELIILGRLKSIRLHGGSCFVSLEDESGKFQAYLKKDKLGDDEYKFFTKILDVGDFVQLSGTPFVTQRGEKTLLVTKIKILTKSLLPLPEKWHGLSDTETRFRKRYLDLIANPEVRQIFKTRSKIIQYIRDYFLDDGFLEVDTPILQPVASGAIAKPFKTYHNALESELYLRIAPELYLKQLVIGGYEKVFEIARCFRNEGIDYSHNPEFTQIEFYWAYKNYEDLMTYMEVFLQSLVKEIKGDYFAEYDNLKINFQGPYPRLDFREALLKETKIDLDLHNDQSLAVEAKKLGLSVQDFWGKGKLADELYKAFVRPKLINPTFIINHPIELSPLAKKIPGRENYVERFQLIVGGRIELMNAFTELNDPLDQEERFSSQSELAGRGDEEAMGKDDEFVEALKHGLPPTAGLGMGIDRLANILTNTHNIREVILFPVLKPEGAQSNKAETMMAAVIINKGAGLELWQEFNTVAHLNASFAGRAGKQLFNQDEILSKDNKPVKLNVGHAILIKQAKNNSELLKLITKAKEKEIEVIEFTREMLETTDDQKIIKQTAIKDFEQLEFLGVLVFGEMESVKKLTKDFSLYK